MKTTGVGMGVEFATRRLLAVSQTRLRLLSRCADSIESMEPVPNSRIAVARARATAAKRVLAASALALFFGGMLAARSSHAAHTLAVHSVVVDRDGGRFLLRRLRLGLACACTVRASGCDGKLVTERFSSMGCDVVVGGATAAEPHRVQELFEDARSHVQPLSARQRAEPCQPVDGLRRSGLGAVRRDGRRCARRRCADGGNRRPDARRGDRGRGLRPRLCAARASRARAPRSARPLACCLDGAAASSFGRVACGSI